MARTFLSHSSKNNAAAIALRDWIVDGGWDENPFLDLDPERGIAAGERWERALHEAADRCEVVLFLVSRDWLKSDWCLRELNLAQKLDKRLFGVLIEELPLSDLPTTLTSTWQIVDLASGSDHILIRTELPDLSKEEHVTFSKSGLARLGAGLNKAGLDPRFFVWPPENDPRRSPYPGLRPLEPEDAGVFFGREASTIGLLDRLRGLREAAPPRLLVILGASGAGKSSFLRAGIIPRLVRDDENFLCLPVIRPKTAVISGESGLIHSIGGAFEAHGLALNRADIAAATAAGALKILPLLGRLAEAARVPDVSEARLPPPALVLSIDQGEELFLAEGAGEAAAFLTMLRELVLAASPKLIVLFTIRSDSYERLQTAEALEGIRQEPFNLPPMPHGAYQTIIEGPVRRLQDSERKLTIDPALTQALLTDIETGAGKDALPLLAFTLERLYREYGADGDLRLREYESLGRIGGSIQAAVDAALEAADADPTIPKGHSERLRLLHRALIPALARVDRETGEPRRRVALISEIPKEALGLIDCLVKARLLATDRTPDGVTIIEPAHDALLRQWSALQGWLKEDASALQTLDGLRQAARDWAARGKSSDWLSHSAGRLEDAERLRQRDDFARFLMPLDDAYLGACRRQEDERRNKALEEARKRAKDNQRFAVAVSILAVLAAGAALYANQKKNDAARGSAMLAAAVAQSKAAEGSLDPALLLMLDGAQAFDDKSVPDEIRIAFTKALEKKSRIESTTLFPNMQIFETDAALIVANPKTHALFKFTNSPNPTRLYEGSTNDSPILQLEQSADGKDIIVLRENLEVQRIDLEKGTARKVGAFPKSTELVHRSYKGSDLEPEAKITENDLIVRELPSDNESGHYVQIIDTRTGQRLQGAVPFDAAYGRMGDAIYLFDKDKKQSFKMEKENDAFSLRKARLDERRSITLRYGECVGGATERVRAALIKTLDESGYPGPGFVKFRCRKFGNNYLLTTISEGSGGETRDDELFDSNGKLFFSGEAKLNVRDKLSSGAPALSDNNFTWVGVEPASGAIGVLVDRNAYVIDNTGALLLDYRHPVTPTLARFLGPNRLLVLEAERGRAVTHDFGEKPQKEISLFSTPTNKIIGTEEPIETLHHGTCVGYAIPHLKSDSLPDGRKIYYDTSGMTDARERHEIRVSDGKAAVIVKLDDEQSCIDFSADWKKMLVASSSGLVIYDFNRVLASRSLADAKIGSIPISQVLSAFFVGRSDDVVTADGSDRVLVWKRQAASGQWTSTELFRGKKPITHAEPDVDNKRLILFEESGSSNIHGFLYSLAARQEWYDLGEDYKWLGAAFRNAQEVVVSKHDTWTNVFPILSLSALVDLAKKELSPSCRPTKEGDYKSSVCWPSSYE